MRSNEIKLDIYIEVTNWIAIVSKEMSLEKTWQRWRIPVSVFFKQIWYIINFILQIKVKPKYHFTSFERLKSLNVQLTIVLSLVLFENSKQIYLYPLENGGHSK